MKVHTLTLNSIALSPADVQTDDDLNKSFTKSLKETDPECAEDTEAKKQYDASYVTQALTDPLLVVEARRRGRSRNRDIDEFSSESISHNRVRDLSEFRFCTTL